MLQLGSLPGPWPPLSGHAGEGGPFAVKACGREAPVRGQGAVEALVRGGGHALRPAAEAGAAVRSAAVLSAVTALTHAAPAHAVHPGALACVGRDVGERDLLLPVADDQGAGLALLHSRGAQ